MSKICPICHTENIDSALFCKNCGNALENKEESGWYVHINNEDIGPISFEEIKDRVASGGLGGDLYVWKEGFDDWTRIRQTELAPYLPVAAKVEKTPAATAPKQNLSDALGLSRPTPFLIFIIIEGASALLQIISLLFLNMSSGGYSTFWPKVFLVSTFMFFISLAVGNCLCISSFRNPGKQENQDLLLKLQMAFNVYPLLIAVWFYLSNMEFINEFASIFFKL